jgi:hypothetical protein
MSRPIVAFSQLDIPQLLTLHNTLAQQSGEPTKKTWHQSRTDLVTRVAILRTLPAKKEIARRKSVARERPLTLFILKLLTIVDRYEDAVTGESISKARAARRDKSSLVSVGLAYAVILRRVLAQFPEARTSTLMLRQMAWQIRNSEPKNGITEDDFTKYPMPQKRPHKATAEEV